MAKLKKIFYLLALNIALTLVIFIFIEGFSSTMLFLTSLHHKIPAERIYTRYDPQLGWRSIPGKYIQNMYGQGVYVRINSQGFRSNFDFPPMVPKGKIRAVCSGDSFTFGYGVDNDHTWCQALSSTDPRLQTVNMGQGGYGIDQAYLWYLQDGLKLDPQIHLFAFIGEDVQRNGRTGLLGYEKPYFRLQNGSLVEYNVPVPRLPSVFPWLFQNVDKIKELSSVKLLEKLCNSLFPSKNGPMALDRLQEEDANIVALKILEDLTKLNKSRKITTIFVYLPSWEDLNETDVGYPFNRQVRDFLRSQMPKRGLLLVDLVDDFKSLPRDVLSKMFLNKISHYAYSYGHYSEEGNQYVAQLLYKKIFPYINF